MLAHFLDDDHIVALSSPKQQPPLPIDADRPDPKLFWFEQFETKPSRAEQVLQSARRHESLKLLGQLFGDIGSASSCDLFPALDEPSKPFVMKANLQREAPYAPELGDLAADARQVLVILHK